MSRTAEELSAREAYFAALVGLAEDCDYRVLRIAFPSTRYWTRGKCNNKAASIKRKQSAQPIIEAVRKECCRIFRENYRFDFDRYKEALANFRTKIDVVFGDPAMKTPDKFPNRIPAFVEWKHRQLRALGIIA